MPVGPGARGAVQGSAPCLLLTPLPSHGPGLSGSFSLELPIGPELAPAAKVLGYVVLPSSEVVADSTELKVAKCFPSEVSRARRARRGHGGTEPFLTPCSWLGPGSPFRKGFPSSPVPVAAAKHLQALISVLWDGAQLPGTSSPLP